MSSVHIDAKTFHRRARYFISQWKEPFNKELFNNVDAIAAVVGKQDEENPYQQSTALQTWFLGYEFPETVIVLTQAKIFVITTSGKAKLLNAVKEGDKQVPLEILVRTKGSDDNGRFYKSVLDAIPGSKRMGVLTKDKFEGEVVVEWKTALSKCDPKPEEVDISAAVGSILSIKDDEEARTIKVASKISSQVLKEFFVHQMEKCIDEEKNISHEQLSDNTDAALSDAKQFRQLKLPSDVDQSNIEWCYSPIVQSGGDYKLKSSAVSNEKKLHPGVILCSLGARYKSYCSNVGRTYLVDPSKSQEQNYQFLLDVQHKVLDSMRDGVKFRDIYAKALAFVRNKRPELEKNFVKTLGFGIGIEFRESNYVINSKNTKELRNGMTLNLSIGFQDLENKDTKDEKAKTYALLLIDTVRVTNDGAVVMTDAPKGVNDVFFFFDDEGDGDKAAKNEEKSRSSKSEKKKAQSAILNSKFRSEEQDEESREQKRKAHQKQLAAQKLADGLKRFAENAENNVGEQKAVFRRFESYKSDAKLPKEVKNLQIVVDARAHTVILPIYGMAVPFHISTLKNVSKSDEGDYVMLRLNFITPGQAGAKKDDQPFDDANANFVRALTYRSADTVRMTEIFKNITDLKKEAAKKEAERKEMEDIVEQDKLIEIKGRRPYRLGDVFARPQMDGKRLPGELEIHHNGLRYHSTIRSDNRIDILFSNVKHLFFQPCDNELIVLLHVHLKNPVMIGKKKIKDIQFYREASDVQFDETGNRRRRKIYGDEDELESEQEERRRRAALNQEFKAFSEKIADASDGRFEIDIPFRELGFQGVPFRSNVLLQPTTECLVHLTDPPFLVITLSEIEIAHLERVQFGLKNFDLVFVFKDFNRAPVHINTIPTSQLDNVKEWLDSVEVAYKEGPVNLNWGMIMKTVNEDPVEFFKNGGWNFLGQDSDAEDSEDQSESASEFELDDSEEAEESSDEESEFASDASEDSASDEELDDSGEDWDELEEKARKADERKVINHKRSRDSDDDGYSKKKRR
ncbi:unnamed protein product [Umbelopsis ramanniana]